MSWFRRTPAPTPRMDPHEARVASAWCFDEQEWHALTPNERAYARTNYTKAPRYVG